MDEQEKRFRHKLSNARWWQKNKEKIREKRKADPRIRRYGKLYYQLHKQEIKEKIKRYQQIHKEEIKQRRNKLTILKYVNKFKVQREELAKIFSSHCFICHKPYRGRFVFHHKWYSENGLRYDKTPNHWIKVIEEVRARPEQFLLLCYRCHATLEYYLHNFEAFKRLVEVMRFARPILSI